MYLYKTTKINHIKNKYMKLKYDTNIKIKLIISQNGCNYINNYYVSIKRYKNFRSEMAYFTRMTSTTKDPTKKNVVLMGRNTWDCIPLKFRPLPKRINMVLTRNNNFKVEEKDVLISNSLDSAMDALSKPELIDKYESVWVIGGSHVYNEVLNSRYFYRLYLTEVMEKFECDTFMPPLPENLTLVRDPEVPEGINEENGIKFVYKVYENTNFNSNE